MAFHGWPEEALDFYEGLEADNSRTYWTRHKAIYEETVLRPMTELVEELRHKGLIAWKEWPVEPWLGTAAARTHIVAFLVAARPLSTWLADFVDSPAGG